MKNKNKNNVFYLIIIPFITLILIGLVLIENFLNDKKEVQVFEDDVYRSNILYYNNTIYLDYDDLKSSNTAANKLINYETSLSTIVDKLMQKDKGIKMYSEDDNKVLETSLVKEDADKIFGDYLDIKDTVKVKILFRDAKDNKEVENIDFKINKEEYIRKKIVETALKEVGKTGETYWEWYLGHKSTFMEYCAAFVSWVGEKNGQIDSGNIPMFAWVTAGVNFYKDKGWFKYNKDYNPKPGDVIFFNWNNANDLIDHVAFVEKYENGYVYTIEGNVGGSSSMSRSEKAKVRKVVQKKYKKNSPHLYGYGVPDYAKTISLED